MDYVQEKTGLAVAKQEFRVVSKDHEMQLPGMDLLSTWTVKQRERFLSALKGAVPDLIHNAAKFFFDKTREIWDPNDLVLDDVMKYCEGHASMWTEEKVEDVAEKAGSWGDRDPLDVLGDGPNAFDITVGNDDSFAVVGYAKSEFSSWEPPVPEATVKAFTAEVQASVVKVKDLVFPAFGNFVRLLKIKAAVPQLDKADEQKEIRMKRARQGKSGGYLVSNDQKEDDGDGADGTLVLLSCHHTRSIIDRVMTLQIKDMPTNLRTRASNFMKATGARPTDHELVVRTSGEFLNRVTSIGGIIIRDHFKLIKDRVFKPADMGGIAGGMSASEIIREKTKESM